MCASGRPDAFGKNPANARLASGGLSGSPCRSLFANSEARDNGLIPLDVLFLQIIEQTTPLPDHSQQTTARMVIFRMRLEMLRQVGNLFAQDSDLHLGRSGIRWVHPIGIYNFGLFLYCK